MGRPGRKRVKQGVAPAVGLALACSMAVTGAHAARVDVEGVALATLAAFPPDTPKTLGGQERMAGMRWDPADSESGSPLRLVTEVPGCLLPGGDDPPPSVAAPGERAGSETFVQTQMAFDGPARPRVGSFRHEVLVGEDDDPRLVVTRGFYDRLSLGLRAVDKTEVRLTVLSQTPRVYGYRDGALIEVVVPASKMGTMTVRDAEGRTRTFACTHARVAVTLDATSGTAMINATQVLGGKRKHMRADAESVQVALSVTRTSHDPAPWVSLAIGVLR